MAPLTISDEEVRLNFPEDEAEANAIATEMLRALFVERNESPEMKLENRPDWQDAIDRGSREIAEGKVISQEEVLQWTRRQRG